ncbi:MAG: YicC/YloC family endoribonuclease, partial [Bacteroidales bacterium]
MIRSMTGYGKAQVSFEGKKYTVEIRSVNGKTADIGFKTSQVPREAEPELRQRLAARLQRGNIDLFITPEQEDNGVENCFNTELIKRYFVELQSVFTGMGQEVTASDIAAALLRMPEVREVRKKDPDPREWELLSDCIDKAADDLDAFRIKEGARLGQVLLAHTDLIEEYLHMAEQLDPERSAT